MPWTTPIGTHLIPVATPAVPGDDLTEDGPAYEVMYLLDVGADVEDERIAGLRRALARPRRQPRRGRRRRAVERPRPRRRRRCRDRGRASRPAVRTGSASPTSPSRWPPRASAASDRTGRRVVAVAAGPGLAELFESAGAVVVEGGPGQRPSTGQLLEAITGCGAAEVVVLPNDGDTVRAAEIAARTAEAEHDIVRRGDPDPGAGAGPGRDLACTSPAAPSTPTSAR